MLEKNIEETILIVDDQPANLRVLAKMLQGANYKVKKAIDGESALVAAISSPPDLILLDIKMPEMNGYEVCQKLKANLKTKHIPIIFISALSEVNDKLKAFQVGGIDYITKPFEEQEVLARIVSQLTIQKQRRLLEIERENLQQEIVKRKETEAILYQSRALISSILHGALDGIAALEAVRDTRTGTIKDFRCLVINPIMAQFFNKEAEDLMGKFVVKKLIGKIHPELFPAFVKVVETAKPLEQDLNYYYQEEEKWYHFIAFKLGDGFSLTVRDITERKKLELKLAQLATIDGLTGISNRRTFDETLTQKWQVCQREYLHLSLILCDVDCFKFYNDHYGHLAGDDCLKQVAQTINNAVKMSVDLVSRYGGEELAIILPNTALENAVKKAEEIRSLVYQLHIVHAKSTVSNYVTLSLGVTTVIPTEELSPEMLIKKADQALFLAKNNGRNRVAFWR